MRFIYTKSFSIFAAGLVVVVLLVFLETRGYLGSIRSLFLQAPRPIVSIVEGGTKSVKGFFSTLFRLRSLVQENNNLKTEVLGLKQDLSMLEQTMRENEALRKELGFTRNAKMTLEPCSIIAKNPLGLTDSVVLNCGREKGIVEGQAVLSQGHLMGMVIFVSGNTSTVLLATNSNFSTGAVITRNGTNVIVQGSFGSGVVIDQIPQTAAVERGWQVVTTGSDKMPKGLLVGEVGEIFSGSSELLKKATLLSPLDFKNLEFAFVVK